MAPFDRSCTTFYWSAIVYIALSGTVLAVEKKIVTLKSGLEVKSFKLLPSESLGAVSYSPSIVTMTVFLTI